MYYTSQEVYEFISKQSKDPILERKICKISGQKFPITQRDSNFYNQISPTFAGQRFQMPTPNLCPEERQRRRLAHINQINLFKRKCVMTGKEIISNYLPDSKNKVVSQPYLRSDACDNTLFGRDFDFSRSFFDQHYALDQETFHPALFTDYSKDVNSAYTNYAGMNKDCYMIFDSDQNESCYYSYGLNHSKYAVDCYRAGFLEYCYQAIDSWECFNSAFLQNCRNCKDSYFLKNCENCSQCLFCSNLVNQEYHIFNKPVSPEEFESIKKELASYSKLQEFSQKFQIFADTFPQKAMIGSQNENVTGNCLVNCKNAQYSYDSMNTRDAKYATQVFIQAKNIMDSDEWGDIELCYDSNNVGYNSYNVNFSYQCISDLQNLYYCKSCFSCRNCFGCSGLKYQEYCILNKKYTKEEYEKLVNQIIQHMIATGEWWEYFPIQNSTFPYNLSMAQDYFPLTEEQCKKWWIQWQEDEKQYISQTVTIPDAIQDIQDDITKSVLTCEETARNYIITPQELAFYRKIGVPVPRKCFWARHTNRISQRPQRELYLRTCTKTQKQIVSVYPATVPFPVYSEEAYNQEVYG